MHTAWAVFVRTVALSVSSHPSAICFFVFCFFSSPPLSIATHSLSTITSSLLHVCSSILCVTRTTCSSTNAQCGKQKLLTRSSYLRLKFRWHDMATHVLVFLLTWMFFLCSSPQHSSFRIPSCELKGSCPCERVFARWVRNRGDKR